MRKTFINVKSSPIRSAINDSRLSPAEHAKVLAAFTLAEVITNGVAHLFGPAATTPAVKPADAPAPTPEGKKTEWTAKLAH